MHKFKSFLRFYSLPILSGFLFGTTYIPFYPWALGFCLVPLWFFWWKNSSSLKALFIGGWITQFILNIFGFHWVAHTASEFGGFPKIIGYLILLLFASMAHLYFAFAGLLWGWLRRRLDPRLALLMIPLIFALCESFYPTIFFWHLGYAWLFAGWPAAHVAEWIGFYGLNMFTLLINLCVLYFALYRRKEILVAAVGLFISLNVAGYYLKQRFQEGDKTLNVLLVQANIGNALKVQQDRGSHFHQFILGKFLELTDKGLRENPSSDLIVWPETAYPNELKAKPTRQDDFQDTLKYSIDKMGKPLLTGAYQVENDRTYNSLVLLDKKGNFVKSYHKTMLLAFGEYFPGAVYLPQLKEWFPMVSDFGRGTGATVLPYDEDTTIGAQICYESLFDDFSKAVVDQGANIIVNVTNDSWYGTFSEPYQHLYMTAARAIEFRVPLVRSTNTGISTVISANGDFARFSPLHEEWAGVFEVKYKKHTPPTLYSYYAGNWHWIVLVLCLGLILGGLFVESRKSGLAKNR